MYSRNKYLSVVGQAPEIEKQVNPLASTHSTKQNKNICIQKGLKKEKPGKIFIVHKITETH